MTEKKICPLLYIANHGGNTCKEEQCMMWVDEPVGWCVVREAFMNIARSNLESDYK